MDRSDGIDQVEFQTFAQWMGDHRAAISVDSDSMNFSRDWKWTRVCLLHANRFVHSSKLTNAVCALLTAGKMIHKSFCIYIWNIFWVRMVASNGKDQLKDWAWENFQILYLEWLLVSGSLNLMTLHKMKLGNIKRRAIKRDLAFSIYWKY